MKRRSYYLRIAIVIGINIVLLTALSFLVGGDVKAITPVYVNPGGDDTSCNGSLPGSTPPNCAVKTIQKGVELVDAGGTISVAVGTYTETVMITKPLTLLGAQADTIPTDASERAGGKSIIRPDASHPYTSSLILVLSDFVTIRGFFLDGNNPTLGSSGKSSNGVDLHVAGAIANGIDQYGQAPPFTPSDYSNPINNLQLYPVISSKM